MIKQKLLIYGLLAAGASAMLCPAVEIAASPPRHVTLTVYDTGLALARELRQLSPKKGENEVRFTRLPRTIDPATLSYSPPPKVSGIEVLEQQVVYDLKSLETMLKRYEGQQVSLSTAQGEQTGLLIVASSLDTGNGTVSLRKADGSVILVPADRVSSVTFPGANSKAYLEPVLLWRAAVQAEGPQNLRINYSLSDVFWHAVYEIVLDKSEVKGSLSGRVGLRNEAGVDFRDARIRLVSTERGLNAMQQKRNPLLAGSNPHQSSALRYTYGSRTPITDIQAEGLSPLNTYNLANSVSLANGAEKFITFCTADDLPVSRFYVYDGVKFDRFQRNRRNDWNYGTESQDVVDLRLEFDNREQYGLGFDLIPGTFRLYEHRADGSVDLLGEDFLGITPANSKGHIRLGYARGLKGERERVGYREVVPMHEYEESFEIRLENDSSSEVEIRVVEHLYRWHDYEIMRADAEYKKTGPQVIEFRPSLKPGGRRAIHYTVRYTW